MLLCPACGCCILQGAPDELCPCYYVHAVCTCCVRLAGAVCMYRRDSHFFCCARLLFTCLCSAKQHSPLPPRLPRGVCWVHFHRPRSPQARSGMARPPPPLYLGYPCPYLDWIRTTCFSFALIYLHPIDLYYPGWPSRIFPVLVHLGNTRQGVRK